ncbi:MAG: hypothetical protein K0R67_3636, partial [Paenibacillus sp.]|nr:hypothetical protein [Paenibacillus sp.]
GLGANNGTCVRIVWEIAHPLTVSGLTGMG